MKNKEERKLQFGGYTKRTYREIRKKILMRVFDENFDIEKEG